MENALGIKLLVLDELSVVGEEVFHLSDFFLLSEFFDKKNLLVVFDLVDMGFSAAGCILYGAGTAPPVEAGAEGTSAPRRGPRTSARVRLAAQAC